jgi:AmmeMemoRadiSam system protein B
LARELAAEPPDTLVISSPHTSGSPGYIGVLTEPRLSGSFGEFGHSSLKYEYENDNELVDEILHSTESLSVVEPTAMSRLDHGVLVFMDFLAREDCRPKLVVISAIWGNRGIYREFGKKLGEILRRREGRYVYVASGDLSHCTKDGPGRSFHKEGPEFDRKVVEAVRENDPRPLMDLDENFLHRAQQCGLFSFLIGFGVMDGVPAKGEVYSYEDSFGVGYLVGAIRPAK